MISFLIITQLFLGMPVMPLSVSTDDDALAIVANPAGLATNRGFNLYYFYNLFSKQSFEENNYFALSTKNLGLSINPSPFSFITGLGFNVGSGLAFGVKLRHLPINYLDLGLLSRPANLFSIGLFAPDVTRPDWRRIVSGLAIRPFTNRITVWAEVKVDEIKKPWFGIVLEPLNGIELKGAMNTDKSFNISFGLSFGKGGIGYSRSENKPYQATNQSGWIRINHDSRRSLLPPKKVFLELKLSGLISDLKPGFSLLGTRAQKTTYEILEVLNKAKDEPRIKGVILTLDNPQISYSQVEEIRDVLLQIKAKGKKVIIYAPNLGNLSYLLASAGDLIVSHPLGAVLIPGFYSRTMLLKGTLTKLGIEAEYERVGKYKNAPEQFGADSLSSPFREVLNSILDDFYGHFISTVSQARGFSQEELANKIDFGFYSADSAMSERLIDTMAYEDELDSVIAKKFGKITRTKLTAQKFQKAKSHNYDWIEPSKIGVIYAQGAITNGESSTDPLSGEMVIGANTITRQIKRLRNNKDIKAIVLRIDSPGGDGFASDRIWREIELTKKKKPVIVSMGTLAASGGYYISCNSDKIFALPTTLTGSIGVFSLKFVTQGLYEKMGMKREVIRRGEHADALADHRKMTEEEREILRKYVEEFYDQFVNKVAKGRNLSFEKVDSIGQGRVWTGNQAKGLGLVDSLGGLLRAIDYARAKAKVKEVELEFYPKPKRGFLPMITDAIWERLFRSD